MTDVTPVLWIGFTCWITAQALKYVLAGKERSLVHFTDSGGMPSSHSAVACSAATVIGLTEGVSSSLFGLAVVVASIVMYDAVRVRWYLGTLAERVNALSERAGAPNLAQMVIWRGHRIREVAAGALLGVGLSWALYVLF
jgi:acid phosphatase family membrane protein YuiD